MEANELNTTIKFGINSKRKQDMYDACFDLGMQVPEFMHMLLFDRREYVKLVTNIIIDKIQSNIITTHKFTLSSLVLKHWVLLTSYEKRTAIANVRRAFDLNKVNTNITIINEIDMDLIFNPKVASKRKINVAF